MLFKNIIFGIIGLIMTNCQNTTQTENEFIIWVNSYKIQCMGEAPQMCLQIQKGDTALAGEWQMFYSTIDGFEWKPGQLYQLIVRKEQKPPGKIPADASSIRYTLVKVVYTEQDPTVRLHDIWALESIKGIPVEDFETDERPTLEIKLSMAQIMGTDGCNQYNGKINQSDATTLEFGELTTTRKVCRDMRLSHMFQQEMAKVKGYYLDLLILTLKDKKGNDLMTFRKVD